MKLINTLRIFVAILFLILPIEILGEKIPKYTKMNHAKRKLEENDNYIIVKYGTETTYGADEFKNEYRQSVDHIKYNGEEVDLTKDFTIKANTTIEIYFSEPITSLNSFFSTFENEDPKAAAITYIDLSHFDSSSVTNMVYMFNVCSSLEEIIFNNFDTSKVTTMEGMFYGCSNLKSLNLLNFDTSNVKNMNSMFDSCTSLEYLDISNFDTSQVINIAQMFENVKPLKYINLYNAQIDKIKDKISGLIQETTTVCQKDINTNNNETCCTDFNLEIFSCDPDNYIKVKYKKDVTYPYGFSIIEYDKSENQYRPDIFLIKNNNKRYKPNETLIIKENTKIEIYLNSTYTTLAKFFYDYYDPNVEYISSIDLTHFDSSLIESLESTFYGCISLESIDLSTFTAPSLTNKAQTFFHCSSLKALDLSKLNSSLKINTNRIF